MGSEMCIRDSDLLNVPVLDLEAVTDKIDEESQPVLDPESATEDAQ